MFEISCKDLANRIKTDLSQKEKVHLHIVCNDSSAGSRYVRSKCRVAEESGVIAHCHHAKTPEELKTVLDNIYESKENGPTIVQLPFDAVVDDNLSEYLTPNVDADGLTRDAWVEPATAKGVYKLLEANNLIEKRNIVIIGRSKLVGKPLAKMLMETNATVTLCHSRTKNLKEFTKVADVIVIAIGRSKFLNSDYLDPSRTVHIVDVGINVSGEGKLTGDVDPAIANDHVFVTPVPGGVGLLTTACLMENVHLLNAYSFGAFTAKG